MAKVIKFKSPNIKELREILTQLVAEYGEEEASKIYWQVKNEVMKDPNSNKK